MVAILSTQIIMPLTDTRDLFRRGRALRRPPVGMAPRVGARRRIGASPIRPYRVHPSLSELGGRQHTPSLCGAAGCARPRHTKKPCEELEAARSRVRQQYRIRYRWRTRNCCRRQHSRLYMEWRGRAQPDLATPYTNPVSSRRLRRV
jgi:hypothetical protein